MEDVLGWILNFLQVLGHLRLGLYPTVLWKIKADKGVCTCLQVKVYMNVALICGSHWRWMRKTTVYIQNLFRRRCIIINYRLCDPVSENE